MESGHDWFVPHLLPTLEEIEAKRAELLQQISIGKKAEEELSKLEASIEAMADVFGFDYSIFTNSERVIAVVKDNPGLRPKRESSPLASRAEAAIRKYGALHMDQLMERMREFGWVATGDYKPDMKNVWSSLSVNKRFVNLGRNVWDLTEEEKNKK